MKEGKTKDAAKQPIPDGLIVIPKKETSKLLKPEGMPKENPSKQELLQQIKELKEQLCEAKETLREKKSDVDALFVKTDEGEQVFTMSRTENPYRILIEQMQEGVVMLSDDNTIIFCNKGFAQIMRSSIDKIIGKYIHNMIPATDMTDFEELLNQSRAACTSVGKEITLEANDQTLVRTHMSINTLEMENISTTFLVLADLVERMEDETTGKQLG